MGGRCQGEIPTPHFTSWGPWQGSQWPREVNGTRWHSWGEGLYYDSPPPTLHGIVWKRHHTALDYTYGCRDTNTNVQPQQNPNVRCEDLKWKPGKFGGLWRVNEQKQGHADTAEPCRAASLREEVAASGSLLHASQDTALTVRMRRSICGVAVSGAWRPGIM